MAVLETEALVSAVRHLVSLGVRVPNDYPPANLNPGGDPFRGVWAEVETATLLTQVVEPSLVEIVRKSMRGDTTRAPRDSDILVHLQPPHRLQVKGPFPTNIREDIGILALARSARRQALNHFRANHPDAWNGVFSDIRIRPGRTEEERSGYSFSVDHPWPVHVAVVRVDAEVLAAMARKNLERWIRKAVRQLVQYDDAVLIPVLNMSRYPLDQAKGYKYVKELFRRHPRWKDKIGGVILVLRGYGGPDPVTGFHTLTQRLVGIENPLAPADRRLDPRTFNPDVLQETVYEEVLMVVGVDPPFSPLKFRHGIVWVDNTPFGALPGPAGQPFAVVPP